MEPAGTRDRDLYARLFLVALGLALAAIFFTRFEPAATALLRLVRPATAALLVLAASFACGHAGLALARTLLLRIGRAEESEERTSAVDRLTVGIPLYGLLVTLVAWIGVHLAIVTVVATLVAALWGFVLLRKEIALPELDVPRAWLLIPPVAIALAGAVTPVSSPDELVYKLAIPRAYALHGRMLELPLNSDSYFPSALSMADLGAMLLAGGIAAKLVHLALFCLTLRIIWRLGDRIAEGSGAWAAALFAWTPALAIVAGWAWAEWGVIGLLLLSIARWEDFLDSRSAAPLAVSLTALGGALSSKYTALPWLLAFLVLAWVRTRARPERGRLFAAGAIVVALFGGLFYVRNLLWTGSPVAPFLLPLSPAVTNYRSSFGGWGELVRGYDIVHPAIVDDALGVLLPLAVLLSPFALRARTRGTIDLFALGAFQFLFFVSVAPTSRLMSVALAPLALLGAGVMTEVWRGAARAMHAALAALAAVALLGQLLLVLFVLVTSYEFLPYLVGAESAEGYLARTRAFDRPYRWIARHTPRDSRILLLGENRSFHLERPFVAAGNLDGPRVAAYLARFATPSDLHAELTREKITHILIHKGWYRVKGRPLEGRPIFEKEYVLEVSPETDRMLRQYLAERAVARYRDATYALFEIRSK